MKMAFHKSNLGTYGEDLPCDLNGYVPEEGDYPEDFDFGDDRYTADFDSLGNGYEGYASDAWDEFVEQAVAATKEALRGAREFQKQ